MDFCFEEGLPVGIHNRITEKEKCSQLKDVAKESFLHSKSFKGKKKKGYSSREARSYLRVALPREQREPAPLRAPLLRAARQVWYLMVLLPSSHFL